METKGLESEGGTHLSQFQRKWFALNVALSHWGIKKQVHTAIDGLPDTKSPAHVSPITTRYPSIGYLNELDKSGDWLLQGEGCSMRAEVGINIIDNGVKDSRLNSLQVSL